MYTGLYAAVSGSISQERHLSILSNNLANVSTVGFKVDKPVFTLSDPNAIVGTVTSAENHVTQIDSIDPLQSQHSLQQEIVKTVTDFSQGPIRQTGNPLDIALEGDGFFMVTTQNGQAYTRQGTFTLNDEGVLTTSDGLVVEGEQGPLDLRGGRIEIDSTGQIRVGGLVRGRLKIVDFEQPDLLQKKGHGLFESTSEALVEKEPLSLTVHQGAVEASNSNPITLMSTTIMATRAYEAYQRVIQAFDETAGRAVNDIARSA